MDDNIETLDHHAMKELRRKSKEAKREKFLEESRKRLDKIMTTKIRTAFIGAIDAFEQSFGFLWGQDKKDSERTESEKQMFELFQKARTEALNTGNTQLRNARTEIANHTVEWKRYHLDFPVKELSLMVEQDKKNKEG
jgi:hypothetical protein